MTIFIDSLWICLKITMIYTIIILSGFWLIGRKPNFGIKLVAWLISTAGMIATAKIVTSVGAPPFPGSLVSMFYTIIASAKVIVTLKEKELEKPMPNLWQWLLFSFCSFRLSGSSFIAKSQVKQTHRDGASQ